MSSDEEYIIHEEIPIQESQKSTENNGTKKIPKDFLEDSKIRSDEYLSPAEKKKRLELGQRLHLYTRKGMLEGVIKCIQDGAYVDYIACGYSALGYAAFYGQFQIARWLVKIAEATVDLEIQGSTALAIAVKERKHDLVALLLHLGANPMYKGANGKSVFQMAVTSNDPVIVATILETGKIDVTAVDSEHGNGWLHEAVVSSGKDVIALLVNAKTPLDIQNKQGKTALHRAVISKNMSAVDYLSDFDDIKDIQDSNGYSALHYAVFGDNFEMVKLLYEKKVDITLVEHITLFTAKTMARAKGFMGIFAFFDNIDDGGEDEEQGEEYQVVMHQPTKRRQSKINNYETNDFEDADEENSDVEMNDDQLEEKKEKEKKKEKKRKEKKLVKKEKKKRDKEKKKKKKDKEKSSKKKSKSSKSTPKKKKKESDSEETDSEDTEFETDAIDSDDSDTDIEVIGDPKTFTPKKNPFRSTRTTPVKSPFRESPIDDDDSVLDFSSTSSMESSGEEYNPKNKLFKNITNLSEPTEDLKSSTTPKKRGRTSKKKIDEVKKESTNDDQSNKSTDTTTTTTTTTTTPKKRGRPKATAKKPPPTTKPLTINNDTTNTTTTTSSPESPSTQSDKPTKVSISEETFSKELTTESMLEEMNQFTSTSDNNNDSESPSTVSNNNNNDNNENKKNSKTQPDKTNTTDLHTQSLDTPNTSKDISEHTEGDKERTLKKKKL